MAHAATVTTRSEPDDELPPCARSTVGGQDTDLWYPDSLRELPAVVAAACGGCRRRRACLIEALTRPEDHGIWAGLTPVMRLGLRRRILFSRDPSRVIREGLTIADRARMKR